MPRASSLRASLFDVAGRRVVVAQSRQVLEDQTAFELLSTVRWSRVGKRPESFALLERTERGIHARFWGRDGEVEPFSADALRCVPLLAPTLGIAEERVVVHTSLGEATAIRLGSGVGALELNSQLVTSSSAEDGDLRVQVGSPHRVRFCEDLSAPDVEELGQSWCRAEPGSSALFVRPESGVLFARVFLSGVGEIASSGLGALAAFVACERVCPSHHREFCEIRFHSGEKLRVSRRSDGRTLMLYGACRLEFSCDLQNAPVVRGTGRLGASAAQAIPRSL